MQFEITREELIKPLKAIASVVEKRDTLPILSHLLVETNDQKLTISGTDMEVESVARIAIEGSDKGVVTVPARKLMDICKSLPSNALIKFKGVTGHNGMRVTVQAGRSRFTLNALEPKDFPSVGDIEPQITFAISQGKLREHIERTQFAMANQDVRYYLNGLLLELFDDKLRTVATDGHRLALCETDGHESVGKDVRQAIIPRKAVAELVRILGGDDIKVEIASNHIRFTTSEYSFTSRLIDGRYPDYQRVIPEGTKMRVVADKDGLINAINRAAILSNEKYKGIRLSLSEDNIKIEANNADQEEAVEEVAISYSDEALEIGFNAVYVVDALRAVSAEEVELLFVDANSCCIIRGLGDAECTYVVMPMRL